MGLSLIAMGTMGRNMTLNEKILRILQTRKGTRPGNHRYGSRLYLLRDKRVTPTNVLLFAKYCKEDIELSDPSLFVGKAKLIDVKEDTFVAEILVNDTTVKVLV